MSLHLNWLAVRSADKAGLLDRLGFREIVGASDEMRSRHACAVLATGWTVIVSAEFGLDLDRLLPAASAAGTALGCEVSEVVMFSRLRSYEDGRLALAVTHDPEKDVAGLEVEGEPPPPFAEIRMQQAALKAEAPDEPVDFMFEAPPRLAKSLCGYITDEPLGLEWTLLGPVREGHGAASPSSRALRDAIRDDLLPLLRTRGWETRVGQGDWPGGVYDVARLQGGWFQALVHLEG